MGKNKPSFEWQICEDAAEWRGIQDTLASDDKASTKQAASPWSAIGWATLLLLLGGWIWRSYPVEKESGEIELRQEILSDGMHKDPLVQQTTAAPLVDGTRIIPYVPNIQIDHVAVQDHLALVRVTMRAAEPATATVSYRETHFYRQTAEGWQRTTPKPDLMGVWQSMETRHFFIRYRHLDASAAAAVAPQVDLLYEEMRRTVGLPPNAEAKILVEITPELEEANELEYLRRTIRVPSPVVLQIPAAWSDATVLHQAVVHPLATFVLLEMQDEQPRQWQQNAPIWNPMMQALRLWAMWESDGPLSVWRTDVVTWLYANAHSPGAHKPFPQRYTDICRTYAVWNLHPVEHALPLTCTRADPLPWHVSKLPERLHLLTPLAGPDWDNHKLAVIRGQPTLGQESIVALETVIEYVVATYGRERLPILVHAAGYHTEWQTLIPEVFGVSTTEFEVGWQAFLAEHYP